MPKPVKLGEAMTRNNADFHGITITHKVLHPEHKDNCIWIYANHPEHGEVGTLGLTNHMEGIGRLVGTVQVHPEFQRKGIATAMWNYAKQQGFEPKHSVMQSPQGKKWAEAVGD